MNLQTPQVLKTASKNCQFYTYYIGIYCNLQRVVTNFLPGYRSQKIYPSQIYENITIHTKYETSKVWPSSKVEMVTV